MTKLQIWVLIFKELGKHLLRRWYVYGTFLIILTAPLPVVLVVGLGWLGYVWYRVLTEHRKTDRL